LRLLFLLLPSHQRCPSSLIVMLVIDCHSGLSKVEWGRNPHFAFADINTLQTIE